MSNQVLVNPITRGVSIVRNPIVRDAEIVEKTINACEQYAMKLNATFAIADVNTMYFEEW